MSPWSVGKDFTAPIRATCHISLLRGGKGMEKHHKFSIWYVLLGVWVVLIIM